MIDLPEPSRTPGPFEIPHPVLLNLWKHHAGWLRSRIAEAANAGNEGLKGLAREMAKVGTRLMDLYTGSLVPQEIARQVIQQLRSAGRLELPELDAWLQDRGGYSLIDLSDSSRWTLRLGPAKGRYLHLHPARWSLNTTRVQANTLKSAVMAQAVARASGASASELSVLNEARQKYLGLLPVQKLNEAGGLGSVIAVLE